MRDKAAWEAYEAGNFEEAASIWESLIKNCPPEDIDAVKMNYAYALVKLKRFDKARVIYENLFEKTKSHIYLHQLGMTEREAGNLEKALELFLQEKNLVASRTPLAQAANLYELSLVEHLLKNHKMALELAYQCLALSFKTTDLVMQGCAQRLLGDLFSRSDEQRAKSYYEKAIELFTRANDGIAVKDIEHKLRALG